MDEEEVCGPTSRVKGNGVVEDGELAALLSLTAILWRNPG